MGALRVDRWLNLTGAPAFLRPVAPGEQVWWRPAAALALMAPAALGLALVGYLVSGLINTWLIEILVMEQTPSWPDNLFVAATSSQVKCASCLLGGTTETVLIGVVSSACMVAVLLAAVLVYRRHPLTWITSAPRFRWRLFWVGLVLFGLLFGAIASFPEALHGWPDRPMFLKAGEPGRIQVAYVVVMLLALPVAAAFEEVLCRGWLLQVSAAFTRSLPAILLFNGLVFSLLHIDSDPGRNLGRAALGMALSWAALRSGGLEIGIGVHAANNLVILLLAQTLQQSQATTPSTPLSVVLELGLSAATVAVVELAARWGPLRRWSGFEPDGEPPQARRVPAQRANSTFAAP